MSAAFDTLKFVEKHERGGFSSAQARATAEAFVDATGEQLATKADIARLEAATKADIARLEAATKADIAKLETSTRADIAKLETGTKADIAAVKADIARLDAATRSDFVAVKAEIANSKHELTIRLGAMIVTLGGFLVAIKYLGH